MCLQFCGYRLCTVMVCLCLLCNIAQPEQLWLNVIFYCYCFFVTAFFTALNGHFISSAQNNMLLAYIVPLVLRNLSVVCLFPATVIQWMFGSQEKFHALRQNKEIIWTLAVLLEEEIKMKCLNLLWWIRKTFRWWVKRNVLWMKNENDEKLDHTKQSHTKSNGITIVHHSGLASIYISLKKRSKKNTANGNAEEKIPLEKHK